MCIQDKVIARRTRIRQRGEAPSAGTVVTLPADPSRLAVVIGSRSSPLIVSTDVNNAFTTVIQYVAPGSAQSSLPMSVDVYGIALMGDLYILAAGGGTFEYSCLEVLSDSTLDLAIQKGVI